MRLLIDSLIAVMLVGILAGVLFHHRREQQRLEQYHQVRESLSDLHEQALYHAALAEAETSQHTYPPAIDRAWFGARPPLNTLAAAGSPWIDTAPDGDALDHPPDPVLLSQAQAGFWYNAARGAFRARVPAQSTDAETLALYNRVNGTALLALPESDPARQPLHPDWGRTTPRPMILVAAPAAAPAPPTPAPTSTAAAPTPADEPVRRSLLGDAEAR